MKTKFFYLFFILLLCLVWQSSAQNTNMSAYASPESLNKTAMTKNLVRNAGFPGLGKFLNDSLQYPELARKNCIEGLVITELTIGNDGIVSAVSVVQGLGFGCDEAVLALLSNMPKWEPAVRNGNTIEQKVLVPVRFILQ